MNIANYEFLVQVKATRLDLEIILVQLTRLLTTILSQLRVFYIKVLFIWVLVLFMCMDDNEHIWVF